VFPSARMTLRSNKVLKITHGCFPRGQEWYFRTSASSTSVGSRSILLVPFFRGVIPTTSASPRRNVSRRDRAAGNKYGNYSTGSYKRYGTDFWALAGRGPYLSRRRAELSPVGLRHLPISRTPTSDGLRSAWVAVRAGCLRSSSRKTCASEPPSNGPLCVPTAREAPLSGGRIVPLLHRQSRVNPRTIHFTNGRSLRVLAL